MAQPQPRELALRVQLRERTRPLHNTLEAQLDLLGGSLTVSRYRRVLQAFHGFYAALEPTLAEQAARPSLLTFPLRLRKPLLERDLMALGASTEEVGRLPRCQDLPPCSTREMLAGCLYVLEGAALGGRLVTRGLEKRLGITKDTGGAFFFGDGTQTAARWRDVLAWLEEVDAPGARRNVIVTAACDTFGKLADWLELQEVSR